MLSLISAVFYSFHFSRSFLLRAHFQVVQNIFVKKICMRHKFLLKLHNVLTVVQHKQVCTSISPFLFMLHCFQKKYFSFQQFSPIFENNLHMRYRKTVDAQSPLVLFFPPAHQLSKTVGILQIGPVVAEISRPRQQQQRRLRQIHHKLTTRRARR